MDKRDREEKVEIVQAVIEAWNAGDMAAVAEHVHPNVVGWGPPEALAELLRSARLGELIS